MADANMASGCTVVLRTLNEAEGLRVLLPILRQQEPEPPRIIAVDSGSTDGPLQILEEAAVPTIKLSRAEFSYGRSINLGLAEVQEPFAALISAHAVPRSRYWLADLTAPMKNDSSIAAVSGAINGQIPYLRRRHTDLILTSPQQYLAKPVVGLVNANSAIRMSVWREHRFTEDSIACEDRRWTLEVLRAGYNVCLSTSADVRHVHALDRPGALYRRGYREHYALSDILPRQTFARVLADVLGRPLVWFARGVWKWIGHVAWRYGQLRGGAAGRRAQRRAAQRK